MMTNQHLYHGSRTRLNIGDFLIPKISFDYIPYVYATNDSAYAIMRSGKFDFRDISIKEDYIDGKYTLVELRKNAFKDIFDTEGYLYYVNKENFIRRNGEFVSDKPVQIQEVIHLWNVWDVMHTGKYENSFCFIKYDQSDQYFQEYNINKEVYLARRRERIKKIKELMK